MTLPDITRLPLKKSDDLIKRYGVKALVATQIFVITGLSVFVLSKTTNIFTKDFWTQNTDGIEGQVAGATSEKIDKEILITIGDQTEILKTAEFNFEVKSRIIPAFIEQPKDPLEKFLSKVKKKSNDQEEKYIDFDQAKLEYWFLNRFKDKQTDKKVLPIIEFDEEGNNTITNCTSGHGESKLPLTDIIKKFHEEIPKENAIEFRAIESPLTLEEEMINSICKQIENFKSVLSKVEVEPFYTDKKKREEKSEEFEFLSDKSVSEIFSIKIVEEDQIEIKIANEEELIKQIEMLKVAIDVEPSKYDYKIKENSLFILGEFEPGRFLNIVETLEELNKELTYLEDFKEFPIIFDEIDQIDDIENLDIQRFPQVVGQGIIHTPLDPLKRTNSIKSLLEEIDAYVIGNDEEFSLINFMGEKSFNEKYLFGETTYNVENQIYTYYESVEILTSLLYRTALETGLPITDRMTDLKANQLDYYTYPYTEGIIKASVVLPKEEPVVEFINEELTNEVRIMRPDTTQMIVEEDETTEITEVLAGPNDFKFKNDTGKPLLITTSNRIGDDGLLYLDMKFYITETRDPRNVKITDFKRNIFTSESSEGFVEKFTREVDGNKETIITTFYK